MAETQNSPNFRFGAVYYAKAMFARYSLLLSILWLTIPFRTVFGEDMISEPRNSPIHHLRQSIPALQPKRFRADVGDDINEVRIEATKKDQFELAAIRISVEQKEQAIGQPWVAAGIQFSSGL